MVYCSEIGCTNKIKNLKFSLCNNHYVYKIRHSLLKTKHRNKGGTGNISSGGYKRITVGGQRIFEHRYIMEVHLGRKIGKKEVVHHINGDKTDNRIDNLEVCTQSEHVNEHRSILLSSRKPIEKKYCFLCGSISVAILLCRRHYSKYYKRFRRSSDYKKNSFEEWFKISH